MTAPLTIIQRTRPERSEGAVEAASRGAGGAGANNAGRVVILELRGRLIFDEDGDHLLREQVASLIAAGEPNILLDLSGVNQMDSGGVGTLVAVYLHSLKRGGKLKLLRPSERVNRVLRMTHLETAFEVFENENDAIRTFDIRPVIGGQTVA